MMQIKIYFNSEIMPCVGKGLCLDCFKKININGLIF